MFVTEFLPIFLVGHFMVLTQFHMIANSSRTKFKDFQHNFNVLITILELCIDKTVLCSFASSKAIYYVFQQQFHQN
jgi:hypothetical protein